MKVRVFETLTGVRILTPNREHKLGHETEDEFLDKMGRRAQARDSTLVGLVYVDVEIVDLPATRVLRHKWIVKRLPDDKAVVIPRPATP